MSEASNNDAFGYTPYLRRQIESYGVRDISGQKFKLYSILYGGEPMRWESFGHGIDQATKLIPPPDQKAGRPGLGFIIAHQGATADYLIVCWWANQNELPMLLFVRDGDKWRRSAEDESVCVWDLEVIWFERNAYIETVLAADGHNAADAYLSITARVDAD